MSEISNYLHKMVNGDKEAIVTEVTVTGTPTAFTSSLTLNYPRKKLSVYDNSASASGEAYYGYSASISSTSGSMPVPSGIITTIPIAQSLPIYFCMASGEIGDLRVEEIA